MTHRTPTRPEAAEVPELQEVGFKGDGNGGGERGGGLQEVSCTAAALAVGLVIAVAVHQYYFLLMLSADGKCCCWWLLLLLLLLPPQSLPLLPTTVHSTSPLPGPQVDVRCWEKGGRGGVLHRQFQGCSCANITFLCMHTHAKLLLLLLLLAAGVECVG
jgi:hypothetical protein